MNVVSEAFSRFGIEASSEEAALFERFADLFLEYNAHTNLSAIRDREGVVEKHFADSLALLRFEEPSGRMLDIWTGGGFPGIPLKIMRKNLEVTLLDSVSKKTKACDHFVAHLGLDDVWTVWARAEDAAKRPDMRAGYDWVVSRATAYMPQILEWAAPFLKKWGRIALYKLPSEEEVRDGTAAAKKFGLDFEREHPYSLSGQERKLFVFRKRT